MKKTARKGIAVFVACMLLAIALTALTLTPAAAATVRLTLTYKAEGANTRITVASKATDMGSVQLDFDMTGKIWVYGSTASAPKIDYQISQVGYVAKDNAVKYLSLFSFTWASSFADAADENGNVELCYFVYAGGGTFSRDQIKILGKTYEGTDINLVDIEEIILNTPEPMVTPTPEPTETPAPVATPTPDEDNKDNEIRKGLYLTMLGTLADCEGNTLSGYNVTLQGLGGLKSNCFASGVAPFFFAPNPQSDTTDKDGKFVFYNVDEGYYRMYVYDTKCNLIATKDFKIEEGKEFAASVDTITVAHGLKTFALTVTIDNNKNIIIGDVKACGPEAPKATTTPGKSGGAPYTGATASWVLFGLVQLICAGAIVTLIVRRRATQN